MGATKNAIDNLSHASPTSRTISAALKNLDLDKKPTKNDVGLGNVENKSASEILGGLTASDISNALGFTPVNADTSAAKAVSDELNLWSRVALDASTGASTASTNVCTTEFINTPDGMIFAACNEGYEIAVYWYNNDTYISRANFRTTDMRCWKRPGSGDANRCRISIRKTPTSATTIDDAIQNAVIRPHNSLEGSLTWTVGSIATSTGADADSTKRLRTGYIPIGNGIKVSVPNGIKLLPVVYKDNSGTKDFQNGYATSNEIVIFPRPTSNYVRIVIGYDDDRTITDTGLGAIATISPIPTGKKWYALGDSITQGYYSKESGIAVTYESWSAIAASIKGLNLINCGVGGSGYAHDGTQFDKNNAADQVDDISFGTADLVTLAFGVNDWKYNEQIGSMDEALNSGTLISNMRYVIEKILTDNPYCKIVVLLPINCWGVNKNYGNRASNYGMNYEFSNSGTLNDVGKAIKMVADYYGIETIDLLHNSVVNRQSLETILVDGVHPSLEGHKQLAQEISSKLPY